MLRATGIRLSYGASLCLRGVDLTAEEIPIMDGSSKPFTDAIEKAVNA